MRKIFKYPVNITGGDHSFSVPVTGKIVRVGLDSTDRLCIWYEFTAHTNSAIMKTFRVFGTGENIPGDYTHLGSCRDDMGIGHVYERDEKAWNFK